MGVKDDSDEVINHPFFEDLDIDMLLKKEIPSPFVPKEFSLQDQELNRNEYMRLDLIESMIPEDGIEKVNAEHREFEKFDLQARDETYLQTQ